MKIYFVRHGETKWNKRSKLQGQVDIPLSENGLKQAAVTADGMKDIPFDCIFSSPLKRAYVTAKTIKGKRDVPIIRDANLMEMNFGNYDGRSYVKMMNNPKYTRYQRFFHDPAHYRAPKNGENFYDLEKRTRAFFEEKILPLEGEKENILVVAHGCVIRSFIVALTDRKIADFWQTPFGQNCSSAAFSCVEGKTELIYENKIYY